MSALQRILVGTNVPQALLQNKNFPVELQCRLRSRIAGEKLPPPEDRSTVVLGKVKKIVPFSTPGVSDKQHPILMQWNKPTRIETCNPSISGDIGGLEHFGAVDLTQPPVPLEGADALKDCDETVRKILSLEYARNKDVMDKLKKDVVSSVQRHPLDQHSHEVIITRLTIQIRNIQRHLIQLYPYKNQPVKHTLTFKIAQRRKFIAELREKDYRKYEWLLERLNLFFKPVPKYDHVEISRKASIERLTDIWCEELKKHRLQGFKRKLQEEQPNFLRSKAEKLAFIMKEELELGLEPTVTQAEVDECLRRAEAIETANQGAVEDADDEYLLYAEEKEKEQTIFLT